MKSEVSALKGEREPDEGDVMLLDVGQAADPKSKILRLEASHSKNFSISPAKEQSQAVENKASELEQLFEPESGNATIERMDGNLHIGVRGGEDTVMQDEDFANREDYLRPNEADVGAYNVLMQSLSHETRS